MKPRVVSVQPYDTHQIKLSVVGLDLFFFSSRRRHTRFDCDWSSDVCSSDLAQTARCARAAHRPGPDRGPHAARATRSEEHTSELQSQSNLVCRLLLEKKKKKKKTKRHK